MRGASRFPPGGMWWRRGRLPSERRRYPYFKLPTRSGMASAAGAVATDQATILAGLVSFPKTSDQNWVPSESVPMGDRLTAPLRIPMVARAPRKPVAAAFIVVFCIVKETAAWAKFAGGPARRIRHAARRGVFCRVPASGGRGPVTPLPFSQSFGLVPSSRRTPQMWPTVFRVVGLLGMRTYSTGHRQALRMRR